MNAPEPRSALVALAQQPDQRVDFFTARGFELAQRVARAISSSTSVPASFRAMVEKKSGRDVVLVENSAAMGNTLVAMEVAQSIGMSLVAVMQNSNVIEGRLSWSATFVIAAINASGRFTPLQFDFEPRGRIKAKYREKQGWNKEKGGYDFKDVLVEIDDILCTAWAYAKEGGKVTARRVIGPPCSVKLAVEEGWYGKSGSKWQGDMQQLMLTYRAGTFFGRVHASDITMGMGKTTEEVIDLELQADGTVTDAAPAATPPRRSASVDVVDAVERPEPEPEPEPVVAAPVANPSPPRKASAPAAEVVDAVIKPSPKDKPVVTPGEASAAADAIEADLDRRIDEMYPPADAPADQKTGEIHWPPLGDDAHPDSQAARLNSAQGNLLDARAADAPAAEPGGFAATEGERKNIIRTVAARGADMRALLDSIGATDVTNIETLEGLRKEQFKAARSALSKAAD